MTDRQKRAAATISFGVVLAAVLAILALSVSVGTSDDPTGDRFPGRQLILVVHTRSFLETLLQGMPALLTIGISIVAGSRLKDWQYYATVAVTVLGILLSLYLVIELSDPDQARRFWAYSPIPEIESYATFISSARPFLVATGAWFVTILGIQLGFTGQRTEASNQNSSGNEGGPQPPTRTTGEG